MGQTRKREIASKEPMTKSEITLAAMGLVVQLRPNEHEALAVLDRARSLVEEQVYK
jgi:hypothetical protein